MYQIQHKIGNIEAVYAINSSLLWLLGRAIHQVTRPRTQDVLALPTAEQDAAYALVQESKDALWGAKTPLYKCFMDVAKMELLLAKYSPNTFPCEQQLGMVMSEKDQLIMQRFLESHEHLAQDYQQIEDIKALE